ncbi:hypothetical protein [Streptomyces sp. AF1A]|jgi:hypothetical protein|uniref:hypothetical protein n=1 Tax=Streptomyces sp. AF1A TaxID=3394350 RepID=UPI0039BC6868
MTTSAHHGMDPTRHPELLAWLAERREAFSAWAGQMGAADRLDFGAGSLDVLEARLRAVFGSDAEVRARRLDPFVQGAVWYLGEVICRTRGMVWKYERDVDLPADAPMPRLFAPQAPSGVLDTPCVALPADGPDRALYPLNILCRALIARDEMGRPVDEHLADALADDYLDHESDAGEE